MEYSFARYLEAKKTVDDRALNVGVWRAFWEICPPSSRFQPLEILELGAGTGTMIQRILDGGMISYARYHALDGDRENCDILRGKIDRWRQGAPYFEVTCEQAELDDYLARPAGASRWDVVMAHAFLDLFDLPSALPPLLDLLDENGIFYFAINFDGETIFEPVIDPSFDALVIEHYHRTMDERIVDGRPAGSSRTGRRLIPLLNRLGMDVLAAGGSDWIVFPTAGRYPADEAYFLHHILYFFESSLRGRPGLDPARLAAWLATRRRQIDDGELVFITHQLDVVGRRRAAEKRE